MSTCTVDLITDSFPNLSIERIDREISCATIKYLEDLLIENILSVQSGLGGGNYSYPDLILKLSKCNTLNGVAFQPHANLGAIPIFPNNPMQPQIALESSQHKEALCLWREQQVVTKALKNQLIGVINQKLIADLHNKCTRCNNKTIQQILECLYKNYRELDKSHLEDADQELNKPRDPEVPLGVFIK